MRLMIVLLTYEIGIVFVYLTIKYRFEIEDMSAQLEHSHPTQPVHMTPPVCMLTITSRSTGFRAVSLERFIYKSIAYIKYIKRI